MSPLFGTVGSKVFVDNHFTHFLLTTTAVGSEINITIATKADRLAVL